MSKSPWALLWAAFDRTLRVFVPVATVANAWNHNLFGLIAGAIGTVGLWTSWALERT